MALFGKKGGYTPSVGKSSPKDLLEGVLKASSGSNLSRTIRYSVFYQIIAFRGIKDGLGCSTLVANVAYALAKLGVNVCVIDTSILNPCQNDLLNTNYKDNPEKKQEDWFDMGFTKKSVLNQSKLDSHISVLAFKDRTVIDLASTSDSDAYVQLAYSELLTKFDIILVDVCSEPTNICMAAMQQAHKVIQVWNNTPHIMRNVDSFVKNSAIMALPLEKMRYVVSSMTVDDLPLNWDETLGKYKFKHLAHVGMSLELAHILATGKMPYQFPSKHEDVEEFNKCVDDIVMHLVATAGSVERKGGGYGIDEVKDGRTEGSVRRAYADAVNDYPEVSAKAVADNEGMRSGTDEEIDLFGGDGV